MWGWCIGDIVNASMNVTGACDVPIDVWDVAIATVHGPDANSCDDVIVDVLLLQPLTGPVTDLNSMTSRLMTSLLPGL